MGGADRDIDPDCHRNRAGCDQLCKRSLRAYKNKRQKPDLGITSTTYFTRTFLSCVMYNPGLSPFMDSPALRTMTPPASYTPLSLGIISSGRVDHDGLLRHIGPDDSARRESDGIGAGAGIDVHGVGLGTGLALATIPAEFLCIQRG